MNNKSTSKTKAIMSLEVLDLIKDKQSERHSKKRKEEDEHDLHDLKTGTAKGLIPKK